MRFLFPLYICFWFSGFGQQIEHRLILFGDAGEMNKQQDNLITEASKFALPGKTSVFFLGDNIYPSGMGITDDEAQESSAILRSQYTAFRQVGLPVTFIAGNHDWDKSGPNGLEKLKLQADFINGQHDAALRFIPEAGIPGPYIESVSDKITVILYDSEYWLFPFHDNPDSALNGKVRVQFLDSIATGVGDTEDKTILIVSHHPMRSFGEHAVRFSWKDHIFPLTRKWKNFYVPLPVLGSVYPVLRSTVFKSPEDLSHPTYKNLIRDISTAVGNHKNVIFVSGHDHGLQYIVDKSFRQIVSGSGSKTSFIHSGKTLKYKYNKQGFCILDCLDNGSLNVSFYMFKDDKILKSFEDVIKHE